MPDPVPQPSRFAVRRLIPLAVIALAAAAFLALGGERTVSFAALARHHAWLMSLVARWGVLALAVYIAIYAALTALSVPGAAVLTIAGGFLFGTWIGGFGAIVGATLGASAIFLAARAGLADLAARGLEGPARSKIARGWGPRAERIAAGFRADAFNYLLVLRLIPLFPFWLVNLAAGIAGMRLLPYLGATFIGIIPGALVYAGLGSGLGHLLAGGEAPDLALVFRPRVLVPLIGLAMLALIPVGYRRWQTRRTQ